MINIDAPDHFPLGFGFISEELKPGTYPEKTQVQAIPQGCGDQPCEEWLPGSYKVTLGEFRSSIIVLDHLVNVHIRNTMSWLTR